ncbi:hypothetical protein SAMN05421721_11534 [Ectothiorhodospira mobilis]|uniref:Uncharacterized protein n=1 Tax=Ectothiorhodospira mobilis TaxID=195064 RepID=A0A1I4SCP1_ECTMO|nr:hypothetical protein [Ectothiorhodospira mobilis]SFM62252.1 hypothetical protein SAMN05421721_11534 [Ectothiorhodospira mobilis]
MAFSITGILFVMLEFFRGMLWFLIPLILLDLILLGWYFKRISGRRNKAGLAFKTSIGFGVFAFVITLILLPGSTHATWGDLIGWIDYFSLILVSLGMGAAGAVAIFPVMLHLVGIGPRKEAVQKTQATRPGQTADENAG